jgi:hypothetical protein
LERRYWDSNCFLKWLKQEPDYGKCKGVILKATEGEIEIITSALTIAEIIYMDEHTKISREKSDEIIQFFENEYIIFINVDRVIAEMARNLLWEYKALRPKDAIHIASALRANVPIFDTFDDYLIKLSGTIGDSPLIIGAPNIPYQETIFDKEEPGKEKVSE